LDWPVALALILGSFLILLLLGMPVSFSFLAVNAVFAFFLWNGVAGLKQLIFSMWSSVASFTLLPVPLFILMGDVMFRAGIAPRMMDALDKWIGKLPGRLSLLAVAGGTIFATMSGSSMSGVAMLGSTLEPEMERRGYSKNMSIGPILASGCLATMIPPTALGVILASLALISVGKLLIAIIIPGLMMAGLYATYIIVRCSLQPSLAPPYETKAIPLSDKIMSTVKHVLPLTLIIFLVIGLILMGVATPSESAALGALGCFALAAAYRLLTWQVLKETLTATLQTSGMVFLIFVSAIAFSQILAFTGATSGIVKLALAVPMPPIVLMIVMQLILVVMGMFLESMCIMMITLPIYMPVVTALGFDPMWFAVMFLINAEIAPISPPFGLCLFVMKGVATPDTTMKDIYLASIPFVGLQIIAIGLVMAFPILALWLPGLMRPVG